MFQEYISSQEKEIDYLFLGDSMTNRGLNPEFINNSFNYGMPGEDFIITYVKLKKILNRDKINLKNVLLQISIHTFSESSRDMIEHQNQLYFYSNSLSYSDFKNVANGSLLSYWIRSWFVFIGNVNDLQILFSKRKTTELHLGWSRVKGNFSSVPDKAVIGKTYAELHFKGREKINELSIEYFLKTLKLAKDNNINIILIKYPVTKEYDLGINEINMSKEDFYAEVFKKADSVLNENYYILDYYDVFFDNPEYFNDPIHLNYRGAEIFSKKINQDLEKIAFVEYVFNKDFIK